MKQITPLKQPHYDSEAEKQRKEVQKLLSDLEIEKFTTENQRRDVEHAQRHLKEQRRQFHAEQARLQSTHSSVSIVTPLRLEPLTLPTFDGSYDQWIPFRDMYESIVHNAQMTTIEKFQRLRKKFFWMCISIRRKRTNLRS